MNRKQKMIQNLMAYGLDSHFASSLVGYGFGVSRLRSTPLKELENYLGSLELARQVKGAIQRPSIPAEILEQLVAECDWSCCLCWDVKAQLVIVHHIDPYAKSQDHSYDNLVVLCPNHHAEVHSKSDLTGEKVPATKLRARKEDFIQAIAEWKAGSRPAPGAEDTKQSPEGQSDLEALKKLRGFINRPAMWRPFNEQRNLWGFYEALVDISRAFGTGILQTREGKEMPAAKPVQDFTNKAWRQQLHAVHLDFYKLKCVFEQAYHTGNLLIKMYGQDFSQNHPEVGYKIDALRNTIVQKMNVILEEAALDPLSGVQY